MDLKVADANKRISRWNTFMKIFYEEQIEEVPESLIMDMLINGRRMAFKQKAAELVG